MKVLDISLFKLNFQLNEKDIKKKNLLKLIFRNYKFFLHKKFYYNNKTIFIFFWIEYLLILWKKSLNLLNLFIIFYHTKYK